MLAKESCRAPSLSSWARSGGLTSQNAPSPGPFPADKKNSIQHSLSTQQTVSCPKYLQPLGYSCKEKTWVLILALKVPHTHCGMLLEHLPQLLFGTLKLNVYSSFESGKGLNARQVSWFHCEHSGNCAYAFKKKALDRCWDREGKGASRCHQYLGIRNHYASSYY